jgi:hypothetical protein
MAHVRKEPRKAGISRLSRNARFEMKSLEMKNGAGQFQRPAFLF